MKFLPADVDDANVDALAARVQVNDLPLTVVLRNGKEVVRALSTTAADLDRLFQLPEVTG